MKVQELQQKLSTLAPELDVLCYSEDEKLLRSTGRGFLLLEIESVETTNGERVRLADGTPYLKLGQSAASVSLAVLNVTSDF